MFKHELHSGAVTKSAPWTAVRSQTTRVKKKKVRKVIKWEEGKQSPNCPRQTWNQMGGGGRSVGKWDEDSGLVPCCNLRDLLPSLHGAATPFPA